MSWFPTVAVYLVIGYCLQKFIVFKLSSEYNESIRDNYSQYTSLLTLCFLPFQMFQYGYVVSSKLEVDLNWMHSSSLKTSTPSQPFLFADHFFLSFFFPFY